MNSFYKLIASILKEAEPFSGHASFRVVDNDAVGTDPIRELSLDAAPLDADNVMVTLSWEGGVKEFEKKMPSEEADHMFQLISTDLSNIVALTSEQKFEEAKEAMKNILKTYAETTDTPVSTTAPKLNTTQAAMENLEDSKVWKQAKVTMQNLFFSSTDELLDFQKKMKELQPSPSQDNVPLWEQNEKANTPKDNLAAPSMSYEDVEEEKAKEHQNIEKQIDEKIKTELESAMQEKAASVFGPKEEELVTALRGVGRNWDEIKKIFVKDLSYDKDSTTIFLDEQKKKSGEEGIEIVKEEPNPLTPPADLVSPETHEKLLKDIEDKKKVEPVEEVKEKEIEKVEFPIKEESAQKENNYPCYKCRKPSTHTRQYGTNDPRTGQWCEECANAMDKEHEATFTPQDIMAISELDEIARADNDDIRKVAAQVLPESVKQEVINMKPGMNDAGNTIYHFSHDGNKVYRGRWDANFLKDDPGPYQWTYDMTTGDFWDNPNYKPTAYASLKVKADDLNPLQEPIQEEPTMETPSQDVVPMGKSDSHQTPNAGDWVMVKSDLKDELPAFKAKFVSDYLSNDGTKYATVETEDQDLLEVELYRVTKITDSKPAAQEADPIAEPQIEIPQEAPVPVTPKLSDLSSGLKESEKQTKCIKCDKSLPVSDMVGNEHGAGYLCKEHAADWNKDASQEAILSIKAEADALLKEVEGMGKTSYIFIKKGLEKHADDSAFEGNGWCRVWISEEDVESSSKYAEILKIQDESARIVALKDSARDLAHEALRLADSAGAKVGVQSWFESLKPSDHDRIDWVALANPQPAEASLKDASGVWPSEEYKKEVYCKTHPDTLLILDENVGGRYCPKCTKGPLPGGGYSESSLKQAADLQCDKCSCSRHPMTPGDKRCEHCRCSKSVEHKKASLDKKADPTPLDAPQPTGLKDVKITPKYIDKEKAVPATPEMDAVLSKMTELEDKLAILDRAKKEIQAKMKEEMAKIDQSGERVQMEAELQAAIEKAGVLIDAVESKVVSWRDKLLTLQNEEVQLVPKITPNEMLEKIYKKFDGAEKFVQSVLNGLLSLAKNVNVRTLVRWPNKKSELIKEASPLDIMNQINGELLAALKELSSPL